MSRVDLDNILKSGQNQDFDEEMYAQWESAVSANEYGRKKRTSLPGYSRSKKEIPSWLRSNEPTPTPTVDRESEHKPRFSTIDDSKCANYADMILNGWLDDDDSGSGASGLSCAVKSKTVNSKTVKSKAVKSNTTPNNNTSKPKSLTSVDCEISERESRYQSFPDKSTEGDLSGNDEQWLSSKKEFITEADCKRAYKIKSNYKKFATKTEIDSYPDIEFIRDGYAKSLPFWIMDLDNEYLEQIVDKIYEHGSFKSKDKFYIRFFIANMTVSAILATPLSLSLKTSYYAPEGKYANLHFSHRKLMRVCHYLVANDYVTIFKGFKSKSIKKAYTSNFIAGEKLLSLLKENPETLAQYTQDTFNSLVKAKPVSRDHDTIELYYRSDKDNTERIHKDLPPALQEIKRQLDVINANNNTHTWTLTLAQKEHNELSYEQQTSLYNLKAYIHEDSYTSLPTPTKIPKSSKKRTLLAYLTTACNINTMIKKDKEHDTTGETFSHNDYEVDFLPLHLRQVWTVDDDTDEIILDENGRIYTPLQNLPKTLRKNLTVNGETTFEIDYSNLHTMMAYHLEGKEPPKHPYKLKGIPRKHVKLAINISLNAKSHHTATHELMEKLKLPYKYCHDVIEKAVALHPTIEKYFFTKIGRKLMRLDATIALSIVHTLTLQGIPVLPLHDSFVVPYKHRDRLYKLMVSEYQKVLKTDFIPKTDYHKFQPIDINDDSFKRWI